MADRSVLAWPFFDDDHRRLAEELDAWARKELASHAGDEADVDATCRRLVRRLAAMLKGFRSNWEDRE